MQKIKLHGKSPKILTFLTAIALLFCSGCITDLFHITTEKQELPENIIINESKSEPSQETAEEISSAGTENEKNEVIFSENEEKEETPVLVKSVEGQPLPEEPENTPISSAPQNHRKSDQEMLDSALEFCQASSDFWEQGDLKNAIDALDQAYSLILKVNTENNPDLLQQREDLRFTISKSSKWAQHGDTPCYE